MRLVTYERQGQIRAGAELDGYVVDLNRAHRASVDDVPDDLAVADTQVPSDVVELLAGGTASLDSAKKAIDFVRVRLRSDANGIARQGLAYKSSKVTLLAPVVRPPKVLCLGLNYASHAAEAKMDVPNFPVLFHKVAGSVVGPGQPVVIPRNAATKIDYEGELAVIIGRRGKHVSEADAFAYIAGYTAANDVSARDLQFRTSQWTTGKMLDTFCPLGPALVTRDEVPDPNALRIRTLLNGAVMQDANTSDMIFNVPSIVSYISSIVTIEPGDVILTGTAAGIGHTRTPPVYMKPGDTVTVEIDRLGALTSQVVAE